MKDTFKAILSGAFLLFLLNLIFLKNRLFIDGAWSFKIFNVCCALGISLFFTSIVSFSRSFYIITFFIALMIGSVLSYYKMFYGVGFNEAILESVLHTDLAEVLSVMNFKILLWILVLFIIPYSALVKFSKSLDFKKKGNYVGILAFAFLGLVIFALPIFFIKKGSSVSFMKSGLMNLYPSNVIISTNNYLKKHNLKAKNKFKKNAFAQHKFNFSDKGTKVVLVIGESARSDRFSINGYQRDTTPNLNHVNNLVSFNDAWALATHTVDGLKNIFKIHPFENEYTFIKIFNDLGFQTYWASMQSIRTTVNVLNPEANHLISREMIMHDKQGAMRDEYLIKTLSDILKKNKNQNTLVVLHTMGSHHIYDDRYTDEFTKYTPTCSYNQEGSYLKRILDSASDRSSCYSKKELDNSYDNTIVYTDYVLSELIKDLKDEKALLIYISDHGHSLGENGIYLHAANYENAPKEQLHIPFIIWFSDKMLTTPGIKNKMLNATYNSAKKVDQSSLIYSILDCINIESDFINKQKSVCSESFST